MPINLGGDQLTQQLRDSVLAGIQNVTVSFHHSKHPAASPVTIQRTNLLPPHPNIMFVEKNRYSVRWPITASLKSETVFQFKFKPVTFHKTQCQETTNTTSMAKTCRTSTCKVPRHLNHRRKVEPVRAAAAAAVAALPRQSSFPSSFLLFSLPARPSTLQMPKSLFRTSTFRKIVSKHLLVINLQVQYAENGKHETRKPPSHMSTLTQSMIY